MQIGNRLGFFQSNLSRYKRLESCSVNWICNIVSKVISDVQNPIFGACCQQAEEVTLTYNYNHLLEVNGGRMTGIRLTT